MAGAKANSGDALWRTVLTPDQRLTIDTGVTKSRARVDAAALFTVTYNGGRPVSPEEPEDDLVLDLFNGHRRTDKGLGGVAAGPDAGACEAVFSNAGYVVDREASE